MGDTGNPTLPTLGQDIDIRSDVSKYRIFRDGVLCDEITDISDVWASDLVTVALGGAFTFENALLRNDIPVRHIETVRLTTVIHQRSDVDLTRFARSYGRQDNQSSGDNQQR